MLNPSNGPPTGSLQASPDPKELFGERPKEVFKKWFQAIEANAPPSSDGAKHAPRRSSMQPKTANVKGKASQRSRSLPGSFHGDAFFDFPVGPRTPPSSPRALDPRGLTSLVQGNPQSMFNEMFDECQQISKHVKALEEAANAQESRIRETVETEIRHLQEVVTHELRLQLNRSSQNFSRLEQVVASSSTLKTPRVSEYASSPEKPDADCPSMQMTDAPLDTPKTMDAAYTEDSRDQQTIHESIKKQLPLVIGQDPQSVAREPGAAPTPSLKTQFKQSAHVGVMSRTSAGEDERMQKHLARMRQTERKMSSFECLKQHLHLRKKFMHDWSMKPKSTLIHIMDSNLFTTLIVTLILSNAFWIGFVTDAKIINSFRLVQQPEPDYWKTVNVAFTVAFTLELLLRIAALKWAFLLRHDWGWNCFDAFVVLTSILELFALSSSANFFRTMRVIRVVRVARIIRVLRVFAGLRTLICAMLDCCSTLFWLVCVMAFLVYIFAVILLQLQLESDPPEYTLKHPLQKHWGSVSESMLSLTMALSGGLSWEVLADELKLLGWGLRPFFTGYLLFILFGIFNVVNGVFVDRIIDLKQRDHDLAIHSEMSLTQAFFVELRSLLEDHGLTDDDMLDWACFEANMNRIDVQMYLQTHNIDVTEAHELFMLLDTEKRGAISIDDFVYGCMRLKGYAKGMDIVLLYERLEKLGVNMQTMKDRQHTFESTIHRFVEKVDYQLNGLRVDVADWMESQGPIRRASSQGSNQKASRHTGSSSGGGSQKSLN